MNKDLENLIKKAEANGQRVISYEMNISQDPIGDLERNYKDIKNLITSAYNEGFKNCFEDIEHGQIKLAYKKSNTFKALVNIRRQVETEIERLKKSMKG